MRRRMPIGAGLLALAFLCGFGAGSASDFVIAPSYEHRPVRLLQVAGELAHVDLRTGTLSRIDGDIANQAVAPTWRQRVPGVAEQGNRSFAIDLLEVNGAEEAFLTDVRDGRTWVLRWRDGRHGVWQEVRAK